MVAPRLDDDREGDPSEALLLRVTGSAAPAWGPRPEPVTNAAPRQVEAAMWQM